MSEEDVRRIVREEIAAREAELADIRMRGARIAEGEIARLVEGEPVRVVMNGEN